MSRYILNEKDIITSREGSSYIRRMLALREARQKLQNLLYLSADWNTFGAESPAELAVRTAGSILESLVRNNLIPDGILASAEGGVAICFVRDNKYADIECLNSGEILAVKSTRHERPYVWTLDEGSIDSDFAAQSISEYSGS